MGLFDIFKKGDTSKNSEEIGLGKYKHYLLEGYYEGLSEIESENNKQLFLKTISEFKENHKYSYSELCKLSKDLGFEITSKLKYYIVFEPEIWELKKLALNKKLKNVSDYTVIDKERELFDYNTFFRNKGIETPLYLVFGASVEEGEEEEKMKDAIVDLQGKFLTIELIERFSKVYKLDLWNICKWYFVGLDLPIDGSLSTVCRVTDKKEIVAGMPYEEYLESYNIQEKHILKALEELSKKGWLTQEELNDYDKRKCEKNGFILRVVFELECTKCNITKYEIGDATKVIGRESYFIYKKGVFVKR